MASQDASSLLNNCLDEIVYFFSRSQHKIVIFEDLDRLGNTEVFVKLREINQIVNNNIRGSRLGLFMPAGMIFSLAQISGLNFLILFYL